MYVFSSMCYIRIYETLGRTLTFQKDCFICFNESPLQMLKNAFYFILKAFFVPTTFKFLS